MTERIPLTDMKTGATGKVAEILGGQEVRSRLRGLGIRAGVTVTKVSSVSRRGPVVVQVGSTQASLGFGVSYKVVVEMDR